MIRMLKFLGGALRSRGLIAVLTLAIPAVLWAAHSIALSSLSVSPTSVAQGTNATGTVRLDAIPAKGSVTVQLVSGTPAVATVPSSVSISSLSKVPSKTFVVTSVAPGCSEIRAQLNPDTRRAVIVVQHPANPSGSPSVTFSSNPSVGGATVTGTVTVVAPTGTYTVQLASSNTAAATVPASVNVTTRIVGDAPPIGAANFPITTFTGNPTVCSVISATRNGITGRALLRIEPMGG